MNGPELVDRTCSVCGLSKSVTEFFRDSRGKDGYRTDCKICNSEKRKANRAANPEGARRTQAAYYRANSDKIKAYVKDWRKANPDKCREYHRSYAERNPEGEKERHRLKSRNQPRERRREIESRYRHRFPEKNRAKAHRRRSRLRENGEYLILDREYRQLYSSACFICGSFDQITVDHIIPLVRGGKHAIGNLQPLCMRCNTRKGSRLMIEFRAFLSRIGA